MIEGVEAQHLDTGKGVEALGGKSLPKLSGYGFCAQVAVAEGIAEGMAIVSETNVINGPAVDTDRVDAAVRGGCAFLQTYAKLFTNVLEIPEEVGVALHRRVLEAMNLLDVSTA